MELTKKQQIELQKIANKYDMLISNAYAEMQDAQWGDFMKRVYELKKQYKKEVSVICKLVK